MNLPSASGLAALGDLFAWPWWLLAIPLPWLARRWLPPVRDTQPALRAPWGSRLQGFTHAGPTRGVRGMPWLAWLAWTLLCVAAARPQSPGEVVQPPASGRDLMLAVDLSGSMGEEDMRVGGRVVDRLTAAKAVLADFLDRREGDRVGLIVFGQRAYALAPLTLDRDSVRAQLLDSVVGLAGRETAIGDAIGLAVKRLRAQDGGQRVLVLLTDGVNTSGQLDPDKAAELAREHGVRIHTVAFGGDGDALGMFGLQLPPNAAEIDEAALQRIAAATGGRAFRARDADQLAGIYAEIDRLEPVMRPGEAVRPAIERYPWPLAAALLLGLLATSRPRRLGGRSRGMDDAAEPAA
ncbi:vWA domain-containing protein [Luteimonas kalidii]|uniref:VWA domain-containing protein n=1 Tax=Luteimonas kalidii TaxID=3042025 RepID=A0ABT6JZI2_9GAMM|nr:VWA domain-containing protein [Luteimonas kalidii]MDH5835596.1 VWA domain-containing protein [Luteimonas kalidii]